MDKVEQITEETEWYDPDLPRRVNKLLMKQLGGVRFSYLKFIKEMTIIAISKSIEDLVFDIRELLGVEFDFWNPGFDLRFHEDLKCVRNLNNVIKHSRGIIRDIDNPSHRSLIDDCGFAPESEVEWLDLDIEGYIAKGFVFQVDVISQLTGGEFPDRLHADEDDVIELVKDFLIPEVLQ